MTHPLTEEMMDKIHGDDPGYSNPYDEDDMRGAADWQLEQVIAWIRRHPWVGSDCPIYDFEDKKDRSLLIADLKKAMRPQEDN